MPRSNKRRRHLERISVKGGESTRKRKSLAELVAEAREAVHREEEQCPHTPSLDRLRAVQAKCEALEEQYITNDVFRRSLTDELWQSLVDHARTVEDDEYGQYDENNENSEGDDDDDDDDDDKAEDGKSTHDLDDNASIAKKSSEQSFHSDSIGDEAKKPISGESFLQWKETSQSSLKTITRHGGSVRDVARKKAEGRKLLSAAARNGSKMTDFFLRPGKS